MAGTIAVSPDSRWSASTWLFDWVVEHLAKNVEEPKLHHELMEIVEENLGWFGLSDYGPDAEHQFRTLIRTRLVQEASAEFSESMANRSGALDNLRQLVDAVESAPA
jgi:hypothetical protein